MVAGQGYNSLGKTDNANKGAQKDTSNYNLNQQYESLTEVMKSMPDPNMSFLDKARPGPKTGPRRVTYHSPKASRSPAAGPRTNPSDEKGVVVPINNQASSTRFIKETPTKSVMPSVQMQRNHMNQFLDTLIYKHYHKPIQGADAAFKDMPRKE